MQDPIEIRCFLVSLEKSVVVEVFFAWLLRSEDHFDAAFEFVLAKLFI